ncbi:MAG: TolC family protein [Candidatus Acidiferrales bacterium]
MFAKPWRKIGLFTLILFTSAVARAQTSPQGPVKITLDEAVQLALEHNHALLAVRTTVPQSEAQEITANLRPNPVLLMDWQFIPIFSPGNFSADNLNTSQQKDAGVSYLFERGGKRARRLEAAKDQTAVTRSLVSDSERTLEFQVASQYVGALLAESTLALAQQDLKSFQNTVDISESRYKAGDLSEGDFLKIKLQKLQFETDVSAAELGKVQALQSLRQLLGFESVPEGYDVASELDYRPLNKKVEELEVMALQNRPDLRAAQQGITAAKSQYTLAQANGKRDLTLQFSYSHVSDYSGGSFFGNIELPIFNRNQGEIARTRIAITQSEELQRAATELVLSDVRTAFAGVRSNDKVVGLYRSGYLDESKQSLDISEYAYKRGAASLLDFLDSERSYRATQLAYRQALASYMLALEQLREAVGVRNLP